MSDDEPQNPASSDTIMAEATLWFGRMRGPEAEEHKAAFERWLARGALHRSFYNRAAEIYAMGKFLKEEQEQAVIAGPDPEDGIGGGDQASRRDRPSAWVVRGVLASAAVAAAITIGFFAFGPLPVRDASPDYARAGTTGSSFRLVTKPDQVLTQRLSDGSKITLSANSSLLVDYGSSRRTLRLERGTSRFEVAHEKRPFIVLAGDGRITARGTIFEVGLRSDRRVTVRLLQGKVDVVTPRLAGAGRQVRRLNAGETISYSPPGPAADAPVAVDAQPSDAAKRSDSGDGYREFDGAPLAAVIDAANRHSGRPIRLASADLADLKVSGHLRLTDPEKLARKLALLFDLDVQSGLGNEIVLRRR